ncbi:unnamed protein product [Anisakis simplex]|uniref:GPI transamidase component PIG-T (inferred by orthology to a human protein) n=1 Tax=Anisakis simplex TaxID=6269 RepID=A0A0M3JTH7_ANISI|nr:unnamed protein product [Anisakis simplex]
MFMSKEICLIVFIFAVHGFCRDIMMLKENDTYTEELFLKRLKSEQLLSQFRFVITSDLPLSSDYRTYPRIIAEVLRKYDVREFHLSLTQGLWHTAQWGIAPQPAAPSGAQLYAWFNGNSSSVDERWNYLVNSLNGIFCTSLLQMVPSLTSTPQLSFNARGLVSPSSSHHSMLRHFSTEFWNITRVLPLWLKYFRVVFIDHDHVMILRYGSLTGENVCTENLTPWRKLLPCKQTGLSMLLNPIKLYGSKFHSMSVHVTRVCEVGFIRVMFCFLRLCLSEQRLKSSGMLPPCKERSRVEMNLNVVTDVNLRHQTLDWSLYELYGRKLDNKCIIADSSKILFERDRKSVTINEPNEQREYDGRIFNIYDINKMPQTFFPFNLIAKYKSRLNLVIDRPPSLIKLHSYLGGVDQQSGYVISIIQNKQTRDQRAVYTHMIPWFMRIYFHTIQLKCGTLDESRFILAFESFQEAQISKEANVNRRNFVPAKDRQRPFLIEWDFVIPSESSCEFSFEFDKAFLKVSEFPPDANHGSYVPAASLTFIAHDQVWYANRSALGSDRTTAVDELTGKEALSSRLVTIFGEALLVSLPVPDFSMPFNVICLVCTAMAMLFGPVHTLTTRTFVHRFLIFVRTRKFSIVLHDSALHSIEKQV